MQETLQRDPSKTQDEALLEFYTTAAARAIRRRWRTRETCSIRSSSTSAATIWAKVGRYKLNKRLGATTFPITQRVLTNEDLIKIVATMVKLNNGQGRPDDIDHLGNRRVRAVGELIQSAFRVGLLRMERVVKERMSIQDPETATPAA